MLTIINVFFTIGHGSSGVIEASVERIIRAERLAVFDAVARSTTSGSGRLTRVADGRRQGSRIHGPYTYIPGASRKIKSSARRFGRI